MERPYYKIAALMIFLAIAWGTLTPLPMPETGIEHSDKWMHLSAFALFSASLVLSFPRAWWIALAIGVSYGAAIELIQPYVNRSGELGDFIADSLGVVIGIALTTSLARVFPKRQ